MKEDRVEAKLDQILEVLNDLKMRVGNLKKALTSTQAQVEEIDGKLSGRCEVIEQNLMNETENAKFIDLKHQFEILQQEKAADRKLINSQQSEITRLTGQVEGYLQLVKREQLSREAYSKRFNLLVHGIDEEENNAWETRSTTETKLKKFLIEGLNIENVDDLQILDLHRLPQHPLYRNNTKVNRPIIFKLASNYDKQLVMNSLKHLKVYNEAKLNDNPDATKIYVSEHLPKPLYLQKKQLLPFYKKARFENKRASWCIQNGEFCLYVDGKRVMN